jgi:predicted nucleotidyltransferase
MSKRAKKRFALEAARFMVDGGEAEYLQAKERAMLMLGLSNQSRLPSNRKIRDCISFITRSDLGVDEVQRRLFQMRTIAEGIMTVIEYCDPYLIGSTLSGKIRNTSDIDLHAYSDAFQEIKEDLISAGYEDVDEEIVENQKGHFVHLKWIESQIPVEITVYPWSWRDVVMKSSVTGSAMKRADLNAVRQLLKRGGSDLS